MDVAFGVIFIIFFLVLVFGPMLRRWLAPLLQRWMLRKMEDNMRRMAGMPTRKEEKKARRQAEKKRGGAGERFRQAASRRPVRSTVGMLRYVAEDVEFTEIKEYSHDTTQASAHTVKYKIEEQVEDVEFVEIKEK